MVFVDGLTRYGPWANMCVSCHASSGYGLGIGRGQKYRKDETTGKFVKVER
jgi:cytochrome c553